MTFIDVTKQNGVGSGGDFARECMGRAVFRQKGHSNKLLVGAIHNIIMLTITFAHQLRAVGLVSGQKAIANLGQMQYQVIILPLVSRTS